MTGTRVRAPSGYLTVKDAARLLQVNPRSLRQLIERHRLVAVRPRHGDQRVWLVERSSLLVYAGERSRRGFHGKATRARAS
jgi:excisionase family DNA binding protein